MAETLKHYPLKYYKSLDGVRGIAALMIMLLHFMPHFDRANHPILYILKLISQMGMVGVPLFFVLSGFLITRILLNSKQAPNYFKKFYIKRALRIFPLYYFFLLLSFILIPAISSNTLVPFHLSWFYYLYLQNIGMTFNWKMADLPHLWSLAVEEHFYLLWPFVVYVLPDKKLLYFIYGSIIFALLVSIYLISMGVGAFYFTLSTFHCLTVGAFLALNEKYLWVGFKFFIILTLIIIFPMAILWPLLSGLGNDTVQCVKLLFIALAGMGVIGIVIEGNTWLNNFFETMFLQYTGKISYGLYVFHPMCFYFVSRYVGSDVFLIHFLLCFGCTYIVSSLSYYLFEIKFLMLKNRFE